MKDFITAKSNVDRLLRYNEQEHIDGGGYENDGSYSPFPAAPAAACPWKGQASRCEAA